MGNVSLTSPEEKLQILRIMQGSLAVRSHFQLLLWLQGDFQELLQHDILISVSGNFEEGNLHYDLVSAMPGVRTERLVQCGIRQLCKGIYDRWVSAGGRVTEMEAPEGFSADATESVIHSTLRQMRYAVFHAISDARFKADHLYILLRREKRFDEQSRQMLALFLPHVDAATRKIEGLPEMQPDSLGLQPALDTLLGFGLTPREIEILEWVRGGKTNIEIGMILNISSFTVKNHLQRIFKKLNVTNRAQAVSELAKISSGERADGAAAVRKADLTLAFA